MAEPAGRGFQHGAQELLRLVKMKGQTKKVGAPPIGVLFVPERVASGELHQHIPRRSVGKEFFPARLTRGNFDEVTLRASSALKQGRGDVRRVE